MQRARYLSSVSVSALALLLMSGVEALAQAQGVEEIVVTARRRSELLLDVPLTITALTEKDIEDRGIRGLLDISDFSPGMFYAGFSVGRNDRSNRRLTFRGMQVNTDVQTRQGSTLFIDGAPVLGSEFGNIEGIERIEVIKGPQSAYFGRSTYSGAVNVITKTPSFDWKGAVTAEAGRFGAADFRLSVEGPILTDKLAFRASGSQQQRGGQYTNFANPTAKLGAQKTTDGSLTLYAVPNDALKIRTRVHYWEDHDGPGAAVGYGPTNGQNLFNCVGTLIPWICGTVPFPSANQIASDNIVTPAIRSGLLGNDQRNYPTIGYLFDPQFIEGFGLERHGFEFSTSIDYEISDSVSFNSTTAYHSNEWAALDDFDRRATASLGNIQDVMLLNNSDNRDFSQDVRVSYDADGRIRALGGVSFSRIEGNATSTFKQSGTFRASSPGETHVVKTWGVYGSVGYDVLDQVSVSLEGRYQWDEVADGVRYSAPLRGTFKSFTPRVILDYKPTKETTLFASYAKGNRPGEFNANIVTRPPSEIEQILRQTNAQISIPEESLDSFELGYKGRFWDDRAQLTASVYYGLWRNIHIRQTSLVTRTGGAIDFVPVTGANGSVNLSGLELEGRVRLTERLTLDGTFSLNNTKFQNYFSADGLLLYGDAKRYGERPAGTPKYSGSASLEYAARLTDALTWNTRIDYLYRSTVYATDVNLAGTGDSNVVNLSLGIATDAFEITAMLRNAFDNKTLKGLQGLSDFSFGGTTRFIAGGLPDRRAWSVRAKYSF